jgi:hypothetical protein
VLGLRQGIREAEQAKAQQLEQQHDAADNEAGSSAGKL